MNVLFISNSTSFLDNNVGGAETSMQLLAEQLAKNGHNIYYVTKNIAIRLILRVKMFNESGIQVLVFYGMRGSNLVPLIKYINKYFFSLLVRKTIKKNNVEVVYCYYQPDILECLCKIRDHFPNVKIIMRMAGMHWYERCVKDETYVRSFERYFDEVDAINYIHEDLRQMCHEKIKELGMNVNTKDEFVLDIGSSVKPGRTKPYSELNNKIFKIVMATRFSSYQKRQDILIKAVSMIKSDIKIEVKLIGDGSECNKIQSMINKLGINDKVAIIPFMNQKELWKEMLSSDLMCHACEYEGLSKIIIESMALGLPVLASNVMPLNSYIIDGHNGFLVDNDPSLWARKIENIINDKQARVRVSNNSMEYVDEYFNPETNVKIYEDQFKSMINE